MKRILLKLSGEFLQSEDALWEPQKLSAIVDSLKRLHEEKIQVAIVIGGGNIFRGGKNAYVLDNSEDDTDSKKDQKEEEEEINQIMTTNEIGMAATSVNALMLKAVFHAQNLPCLTFGSDLKGGSIKPFILDEVLEALQQNNIVIFSGGTGHPFFSTDTAAVLRAIEIKANILLKATKVDGVYEKDPMLFKDAKRWDRLTYQHVCEQHYAVMDACAFELCRAHKMPIFIFNLHHESAIYKAAHQQLIGTFIGE